MTTKIFVKRIPLGRFNNIAITKMIEIQCNCISAAIYHVCMAHYRKHRKTNQFFGSKEKKNMAHNIGSVPNILSVDEIFPPIPFTFLYELIDIDGPKWTIEHWWQ